jgi:hypothetical protein
MAYRYVPENHNLPENPSSVPFNSGTRPNSSSAHGINQPNNDAQSYNVEWPDGHDEIFVQAVKGDYKCPICMLVCRNSIQTTCGRRFCARCIKEYMA